VTISLPLTHFWAMAHDGAIRKREAWAWILGKGIPLHGQRRKGACMHLRPQVSSQKERVLPFFHRAAQGDSTWGVK